MKVLAFLPLCTLQKRVSTALSARQFIVETAVSAKECLHRARLTEYEAVLVDTDPESYGDVCSGKAAAPGTTQCALFVFERHLDLDQRLRLFDAGVDDCVREPFFSAEFAMRLGVSVRLRQAASNLVVSKTGVNVLRSGDWS